MNCKQRKAFTLIEVLVSVVLVFIVVIGIIKLSTHNRSMITYLSKRGSVEFDNSLFLTKKVQRYSSDKKSAYDLLVDEFSIKDFDSRDMLKKIEKKINITEYAEIPVSMEEDGPPIFTFYTNEILLKSKYSARYYTFK